MPPEQYLSAELEGGFVMCGPYTVAWLLTTPLSLGSWVGSCPASTDQAVAKLISPRANPCGFSYPPVPCTKTEAIFFSFMV